jgi:hypothetical protein
VDNVVYEVDCAIMTIKQGEVDIGMLYHEIYQGNQLIAS